MLVILSFFLRIYKFDKVPPGLDWDEAALGFNAYSILKTGKDEYGQFLPLSFRSFGDYKAPLFIYLLVPFVKIFGRTTFALRFPSALFGSLTVLSTYFLTKELLRKSNIRNQLSLISSFLLSISPWHLQFSRVAFEPNIALFFVVLGVFFFLKGIRKKSFLLVVASVLFALSLFTYHSTKIFTPLLFLTLILIFRKEILKIKKKFIFSLIVFILISLPVFLSFLDGGGSRLEAAGIFGRFSTIEEIGRLREEDQARPFWLTRILHNRPVVLAKQILESYFRHFSPEFWFTGLETNWRVSLPFQGQIYLWEAPFFLLGIYYLFLNFDKRANKFLLAWLFLSPLPASIGQLTPHALRMLLVLPVPQITSALGLVIFFTWLKKYPGFKTLAVRILLFFSFLFFTGFYFYNYYVHFPYESGVDWQEGHQEMVEFVRGYEDQVEKIIVTDYYMQPYIFFLWFGKIEPEFYQKKGLEKYEFRAIKWLQDKKEKGIILVGTPDEIPENEQVIQEIKFSNGKTAFRISKI